MAKNPISLPKFAARHIAHLRCRHCDRPLLPANAVAAGVRNGPSKGFFSFTVTMLCDGCKRRTSACVPSRMLTAQYWAAQLAANIPTPPVAPPQAKRATVGGGGSHSAGDESEERPVFNAVAVTVMNYTPGNFDHAEGDPASILTVARTDMTIEPLAFSTGDTKTLITKALVTLATYDDPVAQKLLDKYFDADDEGNFRWPKEPPPDWA